MADVRSMLRAERANRRITHPNASYTSDGKLLCNLCEVLLKTEAAWQGHLHSTGHTLRLSRAQDAAAMRPPDTAGKKRKASSLDSPVPDERKRAKPADAPAPGTNSQEDEVQPDQQNDTPTTVAQPAKVEEAPAAADVTAQLAQPTESIDEAELAAFERELAEMEASAQRATAATAAATISAAPMTAEQLAAEAREEQSAQRGKRDVEIEGEREDAARLLEDEFEEMEGLEERVRKLRERREALRKGSIEAGDRAEAIAVVGAQPATNGHAIVEEEEEEEDEDYDDWGFGGG